MVEWVEVRGRTVDVAVAAAMQELGVSDREGVDIEVIQEPERGFLGLGGRDAIVRVKPRPQGRNRRRRSGRDRDKGQASERRPGPSDRTDRAADRQGSGQPRPVRQGSAGQGSTRTGSDQQGANRQGSGQGQAGRGREQGGRAVNRGSSSTSSRGGGGGRPPRDGGRSGGGRPRSGADRREGTRPVRAAPSEADLNEQAPMVEDFLTGLLESFGLDGQVAVRIDEDVIVATIEGEQTEALVGPRGSVMESIHEITKTVLHRQVDDTARVRIDIAGYAERRRQALSIYARQLIDQVMAEGGEIMLEPMSAADRKVIHDAVAEREGVESYSEGEPPRRYVVIATTGEPEPDELDESPEVELDDLEDERVDDLASEVVDDSFSDDASLELEDDEADEG